MGTSFQAVSVELPLFEKYSGTSKLESQFWLAESVADVDAETLDAAGRRALFESVKADHLERHGEGTDAELRLFDFQELIDDAELPSDLLEMGSEWRTFDSAFEVVADAPEILGKCFAGDHIVGHNLDALWGEELDKLAAALAEVQVEDPELGFLLFEMKAFYLRAAESKWVVLRGLF